MDRAGEGRAEAGPAHHRRADRRAGGAQGRHQLRCGSRPGKGVPPRRDEPRLCLRRAVPGGKGHHPSGGHQLLCGRQHRYPCHARGAGGSAPQAAERDGPVGRIRGRIQGHARAGLHTSAARAAHHRGQARRAVAGRAVYGLRRNRDAHQGACAAGQQGHHGHTGQLCRAV